MWNLISFILSILNSSNPYLMKSPDNVVTFPTAYGAHIIQFSISLSINKYINAEEGNRKLSHTFSLRVTVKK